MSERRTRTHARTHTAAQSAVHAHVRTCTGLLAKAKGRWTNRYPETLSCAGTHTPAHTLHLEGLCTDACKKEMGVDPRRRCPQVYFEGVRLLDGPGACACARACVCGQACLRTGGARGRSFCPWLHLDHARLQPKAPNRPLSYDISYDIWVITAPNRLLTRGGTPASLHVRWRVAILHGWPYCTYAGVCGHTHARMSVRTHTCAHTGALGKWRNRHMGGAFDAWADVVGGTYNKPYKHLPRARSIARS